MMDDIYEYLEETKGITKQEMSRFKKYFESEKYDTDSLFYDVDQNDTIKSSNILSNVCLSSQTQSEIFRNTLCGYIRFKKSMLYP